MRNLPWHLDDYDQAKQAYVSFEMVQEGHWAFQHTPAGRIATKPPLAGWISAGLSLASGHCWELAWRLPPFLCALTLLAVLVREGEAIGGTAGSALAGGAFGLNVLSQRLATLVRTDMMLCLTIFLIGWLIYRQLREDRPWRTAERWQLFALLLASMLIKGPIAYAFLLPGLLLFWWLQRRSAAPGQAWCGWAPWLAPLLIFAIWAVLGICFVEGFYHQVVLTEFLGRFEAGEGAPHRSQPVYYYLLHLLYRFFPWSAALLAILAVPEVRARVRRERPLLWLACWSLGGLLVMSLIPSKRLDRIFPILPPLCLLLAVWAGRSTAWLHSLPARRWLYASLAAGLLGSGGYLTYQVTRGFQTHQAGLRTFGREARQLVGANPLSVVTGKDEGMLLYLRQLYFTRAADAVESWQSGSIDACVLPEALYAVKASRLPGSRVALRSGAIPDKTSAYLLLLREPAAPSANLR